MYLQHLLPHPPGIAVGGQRVEHDPERLPSAQIPQDRADAQVADRREVADERVAGPDGKRDPRRVLQRLFHEFFERCRRRIEAHARLPLAFDLALDPQEDFRVDRLRARVAAPQPAGHGGEQKQRQRRQDQQHGQVDDVLRPEHDAEDVELARGQIEQHRLAVVPVQPRQAVEDHLRHDHQRDAPVGKRSGDRARIDLLADLVEADFVVAVRAGNARYRLDRNRLEVRRIHSWRSMDWDTRAKTRAGTEHIIAHRNEKRGAACGGSAAVPPAITSSRPAYSTGPRRTRPAP